MYNTYCTTIVAIHSMDTLYMREAIKRVLGRAAGDEPWLEPPPPLTSCLLASVSANASSPADCCCCWRLSPLPTRLIAGGLWPGATVDAPGDRYALLCAEPWVFPLPLRSLLLLLLPTREGSSGGSATEAATSRTSSDG
jgi:hypothetical protein